MNNREIKFRIWDKIGKVYRGNLYKYLINADTGELEVWAFSDIYDEWYNTHEDDEHLVVQQYTGLKDKNGKEIYEGDIVTFKPKSSKGPFWVIRYDSEHTMYVAKQNDWYVRLDCETDLPLPLKIEETIRVVGNVFENPELIKN